MAEIGTFLEGKYEILKLIGRGGMSKVYLAMDKNLNKQWAVKEIQKRGTREESKIFIQSALAEANLMKKLDHPCLPRIVDIIEREEVIYVVMDYIEGEPLNRVLDKEGAQEQEKVIRWAKDLCGALNYLHHQTPPIIYRDMKPANIMLQPNGNVKLIDFGIAREFKDGNIEDTTSLGTKGYAAPEQFGGRGQTDPRTDIYCLGVTLYHLLTGKNPTEPPYKIYPIRHWNEQLSGGLENIVIRCTRTDPEERYQSCAELTYALEHYEEEDDEYIRNLVMKKKYFLSAVIATFTFLCIGIAALILRTVTIYNNYETILTMEEKASDYQERVDLCLSAIALRPDQQEGYLELIQVYREDAVFSLEEENVLKRTVNANLVLLQQEEYYADIAYEIGKLYWYYYEYGDSADGNNQVTRMKAAIQWFDDVCIYAPETKEYYDTAEIYLEIGCFHRDITLLVEEAEDKSVYSEYFYNLYELEQSSPGDESELVKLEVYRLILFSLENYTHKFRQESITEEEQMQLFRAVQTSVTALETTTDKTDAIKAEIEARLGATGAAIAAAYTD